MPTGFHDMHPSSGHTLAELLQNLGVKLIQGTNSIGYARVLALPSHTDALAMISHAPSLPNVRPRHVSVLKRVSSEFFQMKALEDDMCVTLAMLRRHINPLGSPLYRLPPALFPEVASHLTSEADLVNVTHVSYHLRNTLLPHPSLWSHLNFKHEMRARAFFERSGRTPLHIDMPRNAERTVSSLAELRQQSKRIATLKLRHWSIQKKFLSEPLPSLRRLEIFAQYYDDDWDEEWDASWAPVWGPAEKATSWTFPSLTLLIVYNLNPTPFYTPHLTCFKFWDKEKLANTGDLLRFLDNCPLLEHIDVLYSDRDWTGHDLIVSLPNLRTYTETTFDQACPLTVLNNLFLPSCSVVLRSHIGELTVEAENILPNFKNPDYLAEIRRVKLGTTRIADGQKVVWALELVDARGTKVCSERVGSETKVYGVYTSGDKRHPHAVHLDLLRNLDGRSVEVLCIDGDPLQDKVAVEFLEEGLGFGNVKTLILSHSAAEPCLLALDKDLSAGGHSRWSSPIYTLIIHPGSYPLPHLYHHFLQRLLRVAWNRKVVGFPFKSVSLFLPDDLECEAVLEELRECVERLEVVRGDNVLDWDVDKYFLDELDHLQKNLDVHWD